MGKHNMRESKKNNDYIIGEFRDEKSLKDVNDLLNSLNSGHLVMTSACFCSANDLERFKKVLGK